MRQLSKILFFIFICFLLASPTAFPAIKGGVKYNIPIDYSKLSENELKEKAREYYFNALLVEDKMINENITNALFLYSVLSNVNPESVEYPVKLGVLYDKLGKDRHAKSNFSKAISINSNSPLPYYYFAEYYYKREMYRKALKCYVEAYKRGYEKNYDLLYRMGDIYEKFGDTRSALIYLREANSQNPNPELENKIKYIENFDSINREFYSDTRIRG